MKFMSLFILECARVTTNNGQSYRLTIVESDDGTSYYATRAVASLKLQRRHGEFFLTAFGRTVPLGRDLTLAEVLTIAELGITIALWWERIEWNEEMYRKYHEELRNMHEDDVISTRSLLRSMRFQERMKSVDTSEARREMLRSIPRQILTRILDTQTPAFLEWRAVEVS